MNGRIEDGKTLVKSSVLQLSKPENNQHQFINEEISLSQRGLI